VNDFAEHLAADRRLVILRLLKEATGYRLNDRVLQIGLGQVGHHASLDAIGADLEHLRDVGAVTMATIVDNVPVATLTDKGLDHVERRISLPGVKRPRPGR